MTRESALSAIEKELARARQARAVGNDGMTRVCARRAAGTAISFWLQSHPKEERAGDAMRRLRSVQIDDTMPEAVRYAAGRLSARITETFSFPQEADPLNDAHVIISHLMEQE